MNLIENKYLFTYIKIIFLKLLKRPLLEAPLTGRTSFRTVGEINPADYRSFFHLLSLSLNLLSFFFPGVLR